VQNLAYFPHRRDEESLAHAKADTAPGLYGSLLRRQAGRQGPATLVDLEEDLERSLRVRHASRGLLLIQYTDSTASAGQYRIESFQQGFFVDRLGQVVLGALALAPDLVGFLILGGNDDHRDVAGFGVLGQLTSRLKTIETRHDDVHQDRIRLLLTGQSHAIGAVFRFQYLVTVLFQHGGQLVHLGWGVINNQNSSHGVSQYRRDVEAVRPLNQEACSTGVKSGTWALIAPSSSSLLKGLVRY